MQICTAIAIIFVSFIGILLLAINLEDIKEPAQLMVMDFLLFISEIGFKSDKDWHKAIQAKNVWDTWLDLILEKICQQEDESLSGTW